MDNLLKLLVDTFEHSYVEAPDVLNKLVEEGVLKDFEFSFIQPRSSYYSVWKEEYEITLPNNEVYLLTILLTGAEGNAAFYGEVKYKFLCLYCYETCDKLSKSF